MIKKLIIVVNSVDFFISHRLAIAICARDAGWNVIVATGSEDGSEKLSKYGLKHDKILLPREKTSFLMEIKSLFSVFRLLRGEDNTVFHFVTIKPVLYGGIGMHFSKTTGAVFAISGLGSMFSSNVLISRLARPLIRFMYKVALNHRNKIVIFQNELDKKVVSDLCNLPRNDVLLVNGSGVDLREYFVHPGSKDDTEDFKFVLACRLLKEKGVYETVNAVGRLYSKGLPVKLIVAGKPDPGNLASLTDADCAELSKLPFVEYVGFCEDVNKLYNQSDVAVLPSYYGEGIPKSLIEAAACGLPIITTNLPGCRDTVIDGASGILVEPRSVESLETAMLFMINNPSVVESYGKASRRLAIDKFSVDVVVSHHLTAYDSLLGEQHD